MTETRKATLQRLRPDLSPTGQAIEVQYNPSELTFSKAVQIAEIPIPGLDAPLLQYVRGQAETLRLELFFDTTESGMNGPNVKPVTTRTDAFYRLVKPDEATGAPPVCQFSYGATGQSSEGTPQDAAEGASTDSGMQGLSFRCLVESIEQRFTLFSNEGVPLRARLSVALREYKTLDDLLPRRHERTRTGTRTRTVRDGETLSQIAAETEGDPAQWRRLTDFNGIDDPLDVPAGTLLTIPARP